MCFQINFSTDAKLVCIQIYTDAVFFQRANWAKVRYLEMVIKTLYNCRGSSRVKTKQNRSTKIKSKQSHKYNEELGLYNDIIFKLKQIMIV